MGVSESVTSTVTLKLPTSAEAGVPEISPVEESIDKKDGSPVASHVTGATSPATVNGPLLYAWFSTPSGRFDEVISRTSTAEND